MWCLDETAKTRVTKTRVAKMGGFGRTVYSAFPRNICFAQKILCHSNFCGPLQARRGKHYLGRYMPNSNHQSGPRSVKLRHPKGRKHPIPDNVKRAKNLQIAAVAIVLVGAVIGWLAF